MNPSINKNSFKNSDILSIQQLNQRNVNLLFFINKGDIAVSNVNQTVNGNGNSTSLNIAGRDVVSNTTVGGNDIEDLISQLEKLKKLISSNEFCDLNNDEVVDDIELVQEQLKSDNPKQQRLKSALERIKQFSTNLPVTLEGAKLVVDNIANICDKIHKLFT